MPIVHIARPREGALATLSPQPDGSLVANMVLTHKYEPRICSPSLIVDITPFQPSNFAYFLEVANDGESAQVHLYPRENVTLHLYDVPANQKPRTFPQMSVPIERGGEILPILKGVKGALEIGALVLHLELPAAEVLLQLARYRQ